MRRKTGSHSKTAFATLPHWLDHGVQDDLLSEHVLDVVFVVVFVVDVVV